MATRERRLAEFNGEGEPPPGLPVEVLCEDHSGTYQLPFACRYVEGHWQNDEAGIALALLGVPRLRSHCVRSLYRHGPGLDTIPNVLDRRGRNRLDTTASVEPWGHAVSIPVNAARARGRQEPGRI